MKKITSLLLGCAIAIAARSQSVGIGTNAPNASAQLDITATNKGLLIPRMNSAAITAIPNPAKGLMVLDTAKNQLVFNIGTPAAPNWQAIAFNSGWSTTGNAGTNATNFIGTTDDKDFIFRRNNEIAGWIGSSNTGLGISTLKPSSTGSYNTAIGGQTLLYGTSGAFNTGIGFSALTYDTSGSYNTASGAGALFSNSNGSSGTAAGYQSLFSNTTGNGNTAFGFQAGYDNITGSSNVFVGYQAGVHETGSNRLYISNSDADSNNALVYGEFDNKILSVGGKLGIGTTTPQNLLHVKNANTNNNASQLIIEGNSNYGDATTAAIEFRSNFSSGNADPSGRIKSYYTSNNYTDAQTVFQTIAPGPVFVDAMVLSNGNVSVPNGSVSTAGNLSATGDLFAGGRAGFGIAPAAFPVSIKGNGSYSQLIQFYNIDGVAKWHLSMYRDAFNDVNKSDLNFTETGVADYRLYLKAGGEVGVGKVPLTSDNDSRLQVKQKGSQNVFGMEASNSTNHWDFYATTDVANTKLNMYYNGAFKGAYDNVTGAYTAASDRRLKKDIAPLQPLLNNVLQLKAYQYHYLDNQPTDRFSNGFMAQDVQQLFPDAVIENTMKDGQKRLGINYQYFTVLAIKGLQEQQQQIQTLEQRIAALEALVKKN